MEEEAFFLMVKLSLQADVTVLEHVVQVHAVLRYWQSATVEKWTDGRSYAYFWS